MTAMGYQATADKDGISTSRERAEVTQRVDHQHIVLVSERGAHGALPCVICVALAAQTGAMAHHLILTHRGHTQNTGYPVGVTGRKHQ